MESKLKNLTVDRIFKLVASKGLLEKDFAKEINVKPSTLSDWKSGKTTSYKKLLPEIAENLSTSLNYLLGKTDDPSPYPNQNLVIPPDIANVQFAFHEGDKDELTQEDIDDIAKYVRYMREKRRKENESKK